MLIAFHVAVVVGLWCAPFATAQVQALTPRPAVQQWMDAQLGMFLHFGLNTFTGQQSGDGNATRHPASAFNPTNLNTSQWVETARLLGAKYVCLTAQHEGGFALWNSSYTNYSSMYGPYGKDVLHEFVESCHAQGVSPCIYFSVSCDAYHGCPMGKCDKDEKFINMKLGQLNELLGGRYGEFMYMWTDHANGDPLFAKITAAANQLQPNMLILGQDVANIGNEYGHLWFEELWNQDNTTHSWDHGFSPDNLTSGGPLDPTLSLGGMPDGQYWKSREADKTISSSGWFWGHGAVPQSAESMVDLYMRSVGRGSNLILNIPPDTSGQIGSDFVNVARDFGASIRRMYEPIKGCVKNVQGFFAVVKLPKNESVTMVVIREDMSQGQHIAGFVIEAFDNQYGVLRWYQIGSGSTVGNQRIVILPFAHPGSNGNPGALVAATFRVRVTATAGPSRALAPRFRSVELYGPPSSSITPPRIGPPAETLV